MCEEVFLIGTLAKMVSSDIQTFSESIRAAMCNVGAIVALLTAALVYDWVITASVVYIGIVVTAIMAMIWRRNYLQNPSVVCK